MKMTLIVFGAILGLLMIFGIAVIGSKNTAISLEESVNTAQSGIDVQLSNRFNKLTELAECVKKYDSHEYKTLVKVITARGKNMTSTEMKQSLLSIAKVAEAYPNLKSQDNYKNLMTEISLTENHLAQHKKAFNEFVRDYRRHCRTFPASLFLGMLGYEMQEYRYYEAGADVKDTKPMKLF